MIAPLLLALLVTLSWTDNSTNEDGFKIQGAPTCTGTFADIGQVGPNVKTWTDPTPPPLSLQPGRCYRVYAFNVAGNSGFSNTVQTPPTAPANSVLIKTNSLVTVSRRATDTSSVIALLVNASTVIGPGGFDISYPSNMTLTVSRRAGDTSSVMAILVNASTPVIINGINQ